MLHFKYIKYRFYDRYVKREIFSEWNHSPSKASSIHNEQGFLSRFLRTSHVREPIVPSNVERSVLTYRRQRLPDYPSSFSNDPLSPSTWRTVSPEIGNRTIHMRRAHPFLDPKWSRIPASKRAPDAVAALKSCVKLFRSWYPHLLPPCYHDPFPVSRLIFVTGEIFFPIFTLLSFHPSRELRKRMTRMKHFFFEIMWGRKDG